MRIKPKIPDNSDLSDNFKYSAIAVKMGYDYEYADRI
jgi:hypothetical protein